MRLLLFSLVLLSVARCDDYDHSDENFDPDAPQALDSRYFGNFTLHSIKKDGSSSWTEATNIAKISIVKSEGISFDFYKWTPEKSIVYLGAIDGKEIESSEGKTTFWFGGMRLHENHTTVSGKIEFSEYTVYTVDLYEYQEEAGKHLCYKRDGGAITTTTAEPEDSDTTDVPDDSDDSEEEYGRYKLGLDKSTPIKVLPEKYFGNFTLEYSESGKVRTNATTIAKIAITKSADDSFDFYKWTPEKSDAYRGVALKKEFESGEDKITFYIKRYMLHEQHTTASGDEYTTRYLIHGDYLKHIVDGASDSLMFYKRDSA